MGVGRIEWFKELMDLGKLVAPVGADLLRMETYHGVEETRVLLTEGKDATRAGQVDGRHEDFLSTCLTSALQHRFAVLIELLTIYMGMSIYKHNSVSF